MEPSEWTVLLKDGSEIDARKGLAEYQTLQSINNMSPGLISELFDLATGVRQNASAEVREGFFTRAGELRPVVRQIVLNSAVEHEGGIELRDPFLHTEQSDQILSTVRENMKSAMPQLPDYLKRLLEPDNDDNSKRSR